MEYIHILNNSEKCSLSLGKKKNVDSYKTTKSITAVHTEVRDTTGQQQEREKDVERRARTRGLTASAERWSNITKYSINNIHKDQRLRADFCQQILSKYFVLFIVEIWIQSKFFLVCL